MENPSITRIRTGLPGLEWVWVLDHHYDFVARSRTHVGYLVYRAKPYGTKASDPGAVRQLGNEMYASIRCAGTRILPVDAVVSVPADANRQSLNLPDELARGIARKANLPFADGLVTKTRKSPEMKLLPADVKKKELAGVYRGRQPTEGAPARVLLVDDLVLSGHTLAAVADALRSVGVRQVVALAATKVTKGMASFGR